MALESPVLALVGGAHGCALWRVWQPMALLNKLGYQCGWEFVNDGREQRASMNLVEMPDELVQRTLAEACMRTDAVMLSRLGWPSRLRKGLLPFLDTLRRSGNALIYEADDDIFTPWIVEQQKSGLLAHADRDRLEAERHIRIDVLRQCDGAIVSTPRLRTVVSTLVDDDFPIEVVPNLIDLEWWTSIKQIATRWIPPLTIGWAGGIRPSRDLRSMAWAWGQVAQSHPDVRFVVQGCHPDPRSGKPSLAATPQLKTLLDYVPAYRIEQLPWFGVKEYPLGLLNIDIACCPLSETPFNRCKTPIKAFEAAAAGSAVVASPTVYGQVVKNDKTGFVCETDDQWTEALLTLVRDDSLRNRLAANLYFDVAADHSLGRHVFKWPAAWRSLVEQAHERRSRPRLVLSA